MTPVQLWACANRAMGDAARLKAEAPALSRLRRADAHALRRMATEALRKSLPNPKIRFGVSAVPDVATMFETHKSLLAAGYTWDGMDGYTAPDVIQTTGDLDRSLRLLGWGDAK